MTDTTDEEEENDDLRRSKYGIMCGAETVKKTREAIGASESVDEGDDDE